VTLGASSSERTLEHQSEAVVIRRVLDAFRGVVGALRVSARASERALGLSSAQVFVLHELGRLPAGSVNELAERTFTHQSSVSVVVSRLTQQGLVARHPAALDGRRLELSLTTRGRARLKRAPEPTQARLVAALQGMNPSERAALDQGLSALVRKLDLDQRPPGMFFENELGTKARGRR
jgi:DNA-binding MarR family transcriptional regulator